MICALLLALAPAQQLAGQILVAGRTYSTLEQLTDNFGARLSGSESYDRAAAWALEQFTSYGLDSARFEPFTLDHSWKRGSASASIVGGNLPVRIASTGWSPSTPKGGVEGEAIELDSIAPESIARLAGQLKGKIAIIYSARLKDPKPEWLDLLTANLQKAGALALLREMRSINGVMHANNPPWRGDVFELPYAGMSHEDGELLRRWLKRGPLRLHVEIDNEVGEAKKGNNVIAEVRGASKPDEWVLLGAHLDSWDTGTGAQDNGSGVAQVLEAARAIAALAKEGRRPARSIRFALFGGEEQGLVGSWAYVDAHARELASCDAVLITDYGAGHPRGWDVEGRADVADALKLLADSSLASLGGREISRGLDFGTDDGFFLLHGIPALTLLVDKGIYEEIHHAAGDTLDKVEPHALSDGAALLAVTGFLIADLPNRFAPQLDGKAVSELMKQDDLGPYLQTMGIWSGPPRDKAP